MDKAKPLWLLDIWGAYELHAHADALAANAQIEEAAVWRERGHRVAARALREKARCHNG